MKIELVVSAMNQRDLSLFKKLNAKSDTLIINQCGSYDFKEDYINGFRVRMLNSATKGVGFSRNLALYNATGDYILFCDDDEVLLDDYVQKIEEEIALFPDCDFFIMKTVVHENAKKRITVKESGTAKLYNSLKHGTVGFLVKRESILKKRICFSTYFGGGTKNGSGEDSLFIRDCFSKKLNIRKSDKLIANVYNEKSSWFTGYNESFFYNKGKLAKALFPKLYNLYILQYLKRHKEILKDIAYKDAKKLMHKGALDYERGL